MDELALQMTAELAEELASAPRRQLVNPRDVPLRFHHLRETGRSPQHGFWSFQSDSEQTLSMRLGSGAHGLLFGKSVVVYPAIRRGKAWDEFKAANDGAVILNVKEHDKAQAIANAVRNHPTANRLLFTDGVSHEHTMMWEQAGRARRSTPDAFSSMHLVELKTTKCAEPFRFGREAFWRSYHCQLADQSEAIRHKTGKRPREVYIVAVENAEPYVVQCFRLTDTALEQGAKTNRIWFERFRACEDADFWPPYQQTIADLDIPDSDPDLVFADESE